MRAVRRPSLLVAALVTVTVLVGSAAGASHSWGGYHWARTQSPFTLKLGDNVSGAAWDSSLSKTSTDWSKSSVLDTVIVAGQAKRNCRPTTGRVEVCNAYYGSTGWLGIAQIWLTGGHISQGVVKNNDTYFSTPTYDTPAWRNMVMCQEVGHTLGLDHQDEIFGNANLDTCMDYTNSPSSNQAPNAHDYAQLESIYAHLDTTTTVGASTGSAAAAAAGANGEAEWGRAIRTAGDGRPVLFERELPGGATMFTFVIWA